MWNGTRRVEDGKESEVLLKTDERVGVKMEGREQKDIEGKKKKTKKPRKEAA